MTVQVHSLSGLGRVSPDSGFCVSVCKRQERPGLCKSDLGTGTLLPRRLGEEGGSGLLSAYSFSGLKINTRPSVSARCPTAARRGTFGATTVTCTPTWSSSTSARWRTLSQA